MTTPDDADHHEVVEPPKQVALEGPASEEEPVEPPQQTLARGGEGGRARGGGGGRV